VRRIRKTLDVINRRQAQEGCDTKVHRLKLPRQKLDLERDCELEHGRIVVLHGQLLGMGRMGDCEVLARQVAYDPKTGASQYCDCIIMNASADLPDGEYTLTFDGFRATATRQRDFWISVSTPVPFT
jgi:hypothetical protein